mmetsp:Transcript_28399/g.51763  ORF Transcript_28399/g.51763 Transcript_28399/m.51763 type:complete len:102 (+) Transcript_28399:676-981(+)
MHISVSVPCYNSFQGQKLNSELAKFKSLRYDQHRYDPPAYFRRSNVADSNVVQSRKRLEHGMPTCPIFGTRGRRSEATDVFTPTLLVIRRFRRLLFDLLWI